jgi:ATP-dependent protease ClpP protease subunit
MSTDSFKVQVLDSALADQIKNKLDEISKSEETPKQLHLELFNTTGPIRLGVEIVRMAHELKIELLTHAVGKLSSCGTVLLAGGKLGKRSAALQSTFVLNDAESEKIGRYKKVNNPNIGIMEYMLQRDTDKRRRVKQTLSSMNVLSAFEAKSLGLIDELDGFESMYQAEFDAMKKKTAKVESEVSA